MRLQTKFGLGILIVFAVLAAGIVVMTVNYVNTNTIREAENRVKIYARAAWEIHDGRIARIHSALEILAQDQAIRDALRNLKDGQVPDAIHEHL